MANIKWPGGGLYCPVPFGWLVSDIPDTFQSSQALTTAGHKYAWIGRMVNKDYASKQIQSVSFRWGSITKHGTTNMQVSIQGVDTTQYAPDGTVSGATNNCKINVGNANITANTWINVSDFTENSSSISFGSMMAVVIEFSVRVAGDTITVSDLAPISTVYTEQSGASFFNTVSWSALTDLPNIVFKFSDGTYGSFDGSLVASSVGSIAFNSGSATKEVGMEFTVPYPITIDGGWFTTAGSVNRDFDVVLWEDNTVLATLSVNAKQIIAPANNQIYIFNLGGTYNLTTGKTYRLTKKPSNVGDGYLYYYDVDNNLHFQGQQFGANLYYNTHDGSNWGTATTTRRLWGGIRICGGSDGASSGGGGGEGKSKHMRG